MKLPEAGKKIESIIGYGKKLETHMGKARKGVWSKNNWEAGGRDLKSSWSIPICGQKSVRKNGPRKWPLSIMMNEIKKELVIKSEKSWRQEKHFEDKL